MPAPMDDLSLDQLREMLARKVEAIQQRILGAIPDARQYRVPEVDASAGMAEDMQSRRRDLLLGGATGPVQR